MFVCEGFKYQCRQGEDNACRCKVSGILVLLLLLLLLLLLRGIVRSSVSQWERKAGKVSGCCTAELKQTLTVEHHQLKHIGALFIWRWNSVCSETREHCSFDSETQKSETHECLISTFLKHNTAQIEWLFLHTHGWYILSRGVGETQKSSVQLLIERYNRLNTQREHQWVKWGDGSWFRQMGVHWDDEVCK